MTIIHQKYSTYSSKSHTAASYSTGRTEAVTVGSESQFGLQTGYKVLSYCAARCAARASSLRAMRSALALANADDIRIKPLAGGCNGANSSRACATSAATSAATLPAVPPGAPPRPRPAAPPRPPPRPQALLPQSAGVVLSSCNAPARMLCQLDVDASAHVATRPACRINGIAASCVQRS